MEESPQKSGGDIRVLVYFLPENTSSVRFEQEERSVKEREKREREEQRDHN